MTTNVPATISIEAIDREFSGGFRLLRFAGTLERRFEIDNHRRRVRSYMASGYFAIVLYDLFAFADLQLVPDVFGAALIARLGIFTPLSLFALWVVRRSSSTIVAEVSATIMGINATSLVMMVFSMSDSSHRLPYPYGTVLIMMFVTVVQRIRFPYAATAVIVMTAINLVVVAHATVIDTQTFRANISFFTTAALLLCWTSYVLEREERRGFLLALRGRLLNEQMERTSKIDPLTGLWNRRHFSDVVAQAWVEAERTARVMAVVIIDIDHFKLFNDTYGHIEGDRCLRRVSACVAAGRDERGETAVRFGGEEFVIFCPGATVTDATSLADRLRQTLIEAAIPHPALGPGRIVTASFGVAAGLAPQMSSADLLARADQALYAAKHAGRDCVRVSPLTEPSNRNDIQRLDAA